MANGDQGSDERRTPRQASVYRFGKCEYDAAARLLKVGGVDTPVEGRVLALLDCLVHHPGQTLTKEDLLAAVWPGRIVAEGSLAKAVMRLRQVLGDVDQQLIQTVHGYGYRLAAAVEAGDGAGPAGFVPVADMRLPGRPNWRLVKPLDGQLHDRVWQVEHVKTRDLKVVKFALDGDELASLKREVTLYRLLSDSLGERAPVVHLLDWNFEEPPFFTESEWIEGGDLRAWIAGPATLTERVAVMASLAEAVAETHALGIIHRDLKPANVLLRRLPTAEIRVCLADFGISAMGRPESLRKLGITRMGFTSTQSAGDSSSGTPLYLAPEVLAGAVPSQRSDLYALGVILYQAIVGDPLRPLAPGWRREVSDPLLSEDIALAADVDPAQRLGDAGDLARRLRALDERRAERAARELEQAQAARMATRLQRVRTHRSWLMALSLVFALGGALSLAQYRQANAERAVAEAVNQFLNQDLLRGGDPYTAGEPDIRVSAVLARASAEADNRFPGQPEVAWEVRSTLAQAFLGLGDYDRALAELAMAEALPLAGSSGQADRAVRVDLLRADALFSRGDFDQAETLMAKLRPQLQTRWGAGAPAVLEAVLMEASHHRRRRDAERVLADLESYWPDFEAIASQRPDLYLEARSLRGGARQIAGQLDLAAVDLVEARQRAEALYGPEGIRTLTILQSQAVLARVQGELDQAEALINQVVEVRSRRLGEAQPETLSAINELAVILQDQTRHAEAAALLEQALDRYVALYGEAFPASRDVLNNLAMSQVALDDLDSAERNYRRALAIEQRLLGPDHLDVLILQHNLAGLLRRRDRIDQAVDLHRLTIDAADQALDDARMEPGLFRVGLAHTLRAAARWDEADRQYLDARERLARALGPEHPRVLRIDGMRQEMALERGTSEPEFP